MRQYMLTYKQVYSLFYLQMTIYVIVPNFVIVYRKSKLLIVGMLMCSSKIIVKKLSIPSRNGYENGTHIIRFRHANKLMRKIP